MYNPELYHYGVKGMKWGVRRRTDRGSSGPRTSYGKNRAYAKAQDKANKALWKADKARWKETKAKVKSGDLSKKSAEFKSEKKQYNSGKARYSQYNQMKSSSASTFAMSTAAGIGAYYLAKRMNMKTNNNRLLGKGDTIYLKPRQYKVYSR